MVILSSLLKKVDVDKVANNLFIEVEVTMSSTGVDDKIDKLLKVQKRFNLVIASIKKLFKNIFFCNSKCLCSEFIFDGLIRKY